MSLNEQREQRLRNLESLEERGFEPYPYSYQATHRAADLQAKHGGAEPGDAFEEVVTIAGRAMTVRMMGKASL